MIVILLIITSHNHHNNQRSFTIPNPGTNLGITLLNHKPVVMKSTILTGCLWMLALTGFAQGTNGRERSGTQLRWKQNSNTEVLEGEFARRFNDTDTAKAKTQKLKSSTAVTGNANATRFSSVQALCDHNSIRFNWVAIQQYAAGDTYEIE